MMNVVLSGLTGAGKTEHARSLARRLEYDYISGSELRASLAFGKIPEDQRAFWLHSSEALKADKERLKDGTIDDALDTALIEQHARRKRVVFDAWFLPWYASERNSLFIWLDVPLEIRAARIHHELGKLGEPPASTQAAISAKDERSQVFAKRHYGFDIFCDRKPFNAILALCVETSKDVVSDALAAIASIECKVTPQPTKEDLKRLPLLKAFKRIPKRIEDLLN